MLVDAQARAQTVAKFGVAEAASAVRAYSEQTHKFWGYFQLVAFGTLGFAWAPRSPAELPDGSRCIVLAVLVAFAVFALGNCILVVGSQQAARKGYDAICQFKARNAAWIDPDLGEVLLLNKPLKPWRAALLHVGMTAAVCLAIVISPLGCNLLVSLFHLLVSLFHLLVSLFHLLASQFR